MKIALRAARSGILAAALFIATPLSLRAITLQDLANGAQIVNGDLMFYGFHNVSQVGDLSVPLDQIFVTSIINGPGATETEPGIRFSSSLWTLTGANKGYDLSFDFHVREIAGVANLADNTLEITGDFVADGRAQVAEGVLDHLTGDTLQHKLVYIDGQGSRLQDHEIFPGGPYSELEISKDFSMTTGASADSRIFVSHIDQSFSQVPDGGPGMAAGFVAFGLIALAQANKRKTSC